MFEKNVVKIDNNQYKISGWFNHITIIINDISKVKDKVRDRLSELGINKEMAGHMVDNSAEIAQLQQRVKDLEQQYPAQELRMEEVETKYSELNREYSSLTEQQRAQSVEYQAKLSAIREEYAAEWSKIHDTIVGWKNQLNQAVSDIQANIDRGAKAKVAAEIENRSLIEEIAKLNSKIRSLEKEKDNRGPIEEYSGFQMDAEETAVEAARKVDEERKEDPWLAPDYPTLEHYDETEFEIEGTVLKSYLKNGNRVEVKIPRDVTSIGDFAFSDCNGLTSITIPDSVKSIGYRAFDGCSGLTSIKIPASVTSIEGSAFSGCSGLTKIEVDENNPIYHTEGNCLIETKSRTLISGCKTSRIPCGVTSIGDFAFSDCSGLTSITIPDSVESIDNFAFSDCSGLTKIEVDENNPIYHTEGNCLIETKSKTLILGCNTSKIPRGVKSIGPAAFCGCSGLTSITIPDSVESIGDFAFSDCSGLTKIEVDENNPIYHTEGNCLIETKSRTLISGCKTSKIPRGVKSIGDCAFWGCSGLVSITIPEGVTSIGEGAFCNCSGLTSITIPDSVESIGGSAFEGCSWLTLITISDSVESIGGSAFEGCKNLTIYCKASEQPKEWHDDWNPDNRPVIWNCGTLSKKYDWMYKTKEEAYGQTELQESLFESENPAIEGYEQEGPGSDDYPDDHTIENYNRGEFEIDCSCGELRRYRFQQYCGEVKIPRGIKTIRRGAFEGCSLTGVVIPDGVTTIGEYAFMSCNKLEKVSIPKSVKIIGESAFRFCYNLKDIFVEKGNSVYMNGEGHNCLIVLDRVTTGSLVVACNNGNATFVVPEYIWRIKSFAFYAFQDLETIDLSYVRQIDSYAFSECGRLRNVTLGGALEAIKRGAFSDCKNLRKLFIPGSVTMIGEKVFENDEMTIECKAHVKPGGWNRAWHRGCNGKIYWGR